MDVAHLDWQALHLMDTRFQTSQHLGVRFSSDLRKRYVVEAEMTNATIVTAKRTSHSKDLFAGFSTSRDSTFAYLRAGDLDLSLEGAGHMEYISSRADLLMKKLAEQWESKHIEQEELREFLPGLCLKYLPVPIIR